MIALIWGFKVIFSPTVIKTMSNECRKFFAVVFIINFMDELSKNDDIMDSLNMRKVKMCPVVFLVTESLFTSNVAHQSNSVFCLKSNKCAECITLLIKKTFEELHCLHLHLLC